MVSEDSEHKNLNLKNDKILLTPQWLYLSGKLAGGHMFSLGVYGVCCTYHRHQNIYSVA